MLIGAVKITNRQLYILFHNFFKSKWDSDSLKKCSFCAKSGSAGLALALIQQNFAYSGSPGFKNGEFFLIRAI